jgi:hypothetical protein
MKPPLALVVSLSFGSLVGVAQEPPSAPLYREAVSEFTSMKTTLYQHKTEVDREAGSYKYDCVQFVSYALRQAAPVAWESVFRARGLAKGRIPSPPSYQQFFASLSETPQPGWEAVRGAKDLQPGDVVSWDYKTERATGHAVIIAAVLVVLIVALLAPYTAYRVSQKVSSPGAKGIVWASVPALFAAAYAFIERLH